jgi:hypothetical protein
MIHTLYLNQYESFMKHEAEWCMKREGILDVKRDV